MLTQDAENRQALRDAGLWDLGGHIRADPVRAARTLLGRELWSKQAEILLAVFEHARVAVRSGNGVGKTFTAGTVAPLFALAYPGSTVLTTAPTGRQVREVLWREIRVAWNEARRTIDDAMRRVGVAYVPLPEAKQVGIDLAEDWFLLGQSTDEPERFAGYHAEYLLTIIDEASGVSDKIYEASEGNLTSGGAHLLAIGNPTQTAGQFYRCFTVDAAAWHKIHISVLDSPNFTDEAVSDRVARRLTSRAWVDDRIAVWGVNHPLTQVRIFGNFPSTSDRTIISLADVEAAQRREPDPDTVRLDAHPVLAIDVSRYGSDETVIAQLRGGEITLLRVYSGRSTTETVGMAIDAAQDLLDDNALSVTIVVDDVGVGGGVTDQLVELISDRVSVVPFSGGSHAIDEVHYANSRSEAWHRFSEWLHRDGILADGPNGQPEEQLTADLVAPEYTFDSRGRIVLEPKADTKKRLGRSPDRADAVVMLLDPGPLTREAMDAHLQQVTEPETRDELSARRSSWEERY